MVTMRPITLETHKAAYIHNLPVSREARRQQYWGHDVIRVSMRDQKPVHFKTRSDGDYWIAVLRDKEDLTNRRKNKIKRQRKALKELNTAVIKKNYEILKLKEQVAEMEYQRDLVHDKLLRVTGAPRFE